MKNSFVKFLIENNILAETLYEAEHNVLMLSDQSIKRGMYFTGAIHEQIDRGIAPKIRSFDPNASGWDCYLCCLAIYDLLCEHHPEWNIEK